MNTHIKFDASHYRKSEKGAALLTTLLAAILLLSAGLALLTSVSLSTTGLIDSTAEAQAYSGAEAGLEATLNVFRGNVVPDASLNGTLMNFRNAANPATANKTADSWATGTSASSRLSGWLPYSYQNPNDANDWRVPITANYAPTTGIGYKITVSDPDDSGPIATRKITTDATYQPSRLMIRSEGYGPKGALKRLEMIIAPTAFDFTPPATVLVRGNDDGESVIPTFNIGNSNAKSYSGFDNAAPANSIPVFGVTHGNDLTAVTNEINSAKPNTLSGVDKVKALEISDLPVFLQDADSARAFLNEMQATAAAEGRYFTSTPASYGTTANPKFTFCDGDCDLSTGAGLLIVTGTLTASGNVGFQGVILVLGEGVFQRNGGGNGDTMGAIVVARFDRTWPEDENDEEHPFLSPTYDMNGGGNSTTGYDSAQVRNALGVLGVRTVGLREY